MAATRPREVPRRLEYPEARKRFLSRIRTGDGTVKAHPAAGGSWRGRCRHASRYRVASLKDPRRGMGEGRSRAAGRHGGGHQGAAHRVVGAVLRAGEVSSPPAPVAGTLRVGAALLAGVEDACEADQCIRASRIRGAASPSPDGQVRDAGSPP